MKKIIIITILSAIFFSGHAQHTLTFNKCLLDSSTTLTVPSIAGGSTYNAVWKIVSFMPNTNTIAGTIGSQNIPAIGDYDIVVGGTTEYITHVGAAYYDFHGAVPGTNVFFTNVNSSLLPMWLPGGTTLAAGTNIKYVSVLEFIVN